MFAHKYKFDYFTKTKVLLMNVMNFIQLTVFREVMISGSVSQAARKLNRTQPAVSLAIRNLEESLGIRLFERQGRQLIPVPEAHYLLAEAGDILDRLSTVSRTMKSLLNAQTGNLKIAAMPGPSTFLLPRFISGFAGGNRDIRISLSSRSSPQIMELAGTQSIDFGFADLDPRAQKAPQYHQDIITAECFCALPRDHRLAGQDVVSCGDLDGEPMGALQSHHMIFRRTAETFLAAGARFDPVVDSQIFIPLMQFVSAGQCCAIVDPLTVVSERESGSTKGTVVFRPLSVPLRYDYAILTPRHRPLSQLALRVKEGWKAEVVRLLALIDSKPAIGAAADGGEAPAPDRAGA